MSVKARISSDQRDSGDVEAEAAILIADGKVWLAAGEVRAFDLWLVLTEYLAAQMQPSRRWQALLAAIAGGRAAKRADARGEALPDYTDASTVLAVIKETEGADVYARVRQALVDRMLGR